MDRFSKCCSIIFHFYGGTWICDNTAQEMVPLKMKNNCSGNGTPKMKKSTTNKAKRKMFGLKIKMFLSSRHSCRRNRAPGLGVGLLPDGWIQPRLGCGVGIPCLRHAGPAPQVSGAVGFASFPEIEFLNGSVEVSGHKLESSQARVFVWFSTLIFRSPKCYSWVDSIVMFCGFLKPEKSMFFFKIRQ